MLGSKKDGHWLLLCPVNSVLPPALGPERGRGVSAACPSGVLGSPQPQPSGEVGHWHPCVADTALHPHPRDSLKWSNCTLRRALSERLPCPPRQGSREPTALPFSFAGAGPALGWIRTLSAKGPKAEMLIPRLHPPTCPASCYLGNSKQKQ